ncbi:hypothetical protein VTK73DRAFT_5797 [Phialemonium thermophilum]|uniref:Uncharacterized protein n=1 Tax=Phialemonium thermophilum TaxID=223376 RepID=A0ABR3V0H2_9PEZI
MPSLWSRIKENLLYLFLLVCNLAIKGASAAYVLETSAFSWPAVRGQPQLRQPPYPGGLFVTEEMTLIVASVALGWELVKTVVLFYTMVFREMDPRQLPKPALFAIGVVELAVTACFVALLRMQAAYTPGSCKHADEWRFDADGVPSLFAVLAQHWPVHAKKMTAQSVCTLFIVRRTSEIVYTYAAFSFFIFFFFSLPG